MRKKYFARAFLSPTNLTYRLFYQFEPFPRFISTKAGFLSFSLKLLQNYCSVCPFLLPRDDTGGQRWPGRHTWVCGRFPTTFKGAKASRPEISLANAPSLVTRGSLVAFSSFCSTCSSLRFSAPDHFVPRGASSHPPPHRERFAGPIHPHVGAYREAGVRAPSTSGHSIAGRFGVCPSFGSQRAEFPPNSGACEAFQHSGAHRRFDEFDSWSS